LLKVKTGADKQECYFISSQTRRSWQNKRACTLFSQQQDKRKGTERPSDEWKAISHCNLLSIILLGVGGTIYTTHSLKPFKELGLDSQRVKKLASKLHVYSVNFAAKLVHTRRALSSTAINSHQELVSGQARNPLDPH
jgi:hypothetical protein